MISNNNKKNKITLLKLKAVIKKHKMLISNMKIK